MPWPILICKTDQCDTSRGQVVVHKGIDFKLADIIESEIVGWDSVVGLENSKHELIEMAISHVKSSDLVTG